MNWSTIVFVAAGLCACTPVHMAVPPDLAAAASVYDVQNRSNWKGALIDESFNFGPYRVAKVNRDWTSSSGWGVGAYSTAAIKTGYAYVLATPAGELQGHCGVEAGKDEFAVFGGHMSSLQTTLACACGADASGARFVIKSNNDGLLAGAAMVGDVNLAVTPIDRDDSGYQRPGGLGWQLRGAGPIGGVETQHPGRFWLEKSLAPATANEAACLLAGLLLYEPPQSH